VLVTIWLRAGMACSIRLSGAVVLASAGVLRSPLRPTTQVHNNGHSVHPSYACMRHRDPIQAPTTGNVKVAG
jgi:hypothetical protein